MLQDSVYYQHLIAKGEQIGLEEGKVLGLEEGKVLGLEKGLEEGERDAILRVGQVRFKKVPKWVQAHLAKVTDLDELRKLVERVAVANSWDEALRS